MKSAVVSILLLVISSCSIQYEPSTLSSADHSQIKSDTLLNSERIRLEFGSYGVEVLYSDSTTRITSLYSTEGDLNVTRTYALVMYPSNVDSAMFAEHTDILSGGSIGHVFKEGGWTIDKRSIYIGQISTSEIHDDIYSLMGGIDATELAVYMYSFNVWKTGMSYEYATIIEVYHPDYLVEEDLNRIYGKVPVGSGADPRVDMLLDTVKRYLALDLRLVDPLTP